MEELAALEARLGEASESGQEPQGKQIAPAEFQLLLEEVKRLRGLVPKNNWGEEAALFEEVARINPLDLQHLLREFGNDCATLALALYTTDQETKEAVLSSLSERVREDVEEESELLASRRVKRSDIDCARARLVDLAKKMEAGGEITLLPAEKTL